jgi:phosphoserine phosphatase
LGFDLWSFLHGYPRLCLNLPNLYTRLMDSVLTVIGDPASRAVDSALVEAAGAALAEAGARVAAPDWLAPGIACDLPFDDLTCARAEAAARGRLDGAPIDLAAQAAAGRRKGLLVADMESTIIGQELIDELAEIAGVHDRIAAITARSLAGEVDFASSFYERVGLLAGLTTDTLARVAERITLNPGARTLIRTLNAGGAHTALVTGGFTCFAEAVARDCGFDEVRANELLIDGDRLSGAAREPILGPKAKAAALTELAERHGLAIAATAAVGDGANDLDMVRTAGMGVAYRGKPVLRQAARFRLDHGDLTALLYLQGYRQDEFIN